MNFQKLIEARKKNDQFFSKLKDWSDANEFRCEASQSENTLTIFGPIGDFGGWLEDGITSKMVSSALASLDNRRALNVDINSFGGDAFEGVSIYNLLKSDKRKINVRVTGMAGSAASVIAMAGDKIEMGSGAMMMIHRAWTLAVGNSIELAETSEMLNRLDVGLSEIYAEKTGTPAEEILATMHPDRYLTASEAVEAGFATSLANNKTTAKTLATVKPTAMSQLFLNRR